MITALISVLIWLAFLVVAFWILKLALEHFQGPPVLLQIVGLIFTLILLLVILRGVGVVGGGPLPWHP